MKNSLEPRIELTQIDPRTRYFSALGGAVLALFPLIPLGVLCVKFAWPLWLLLIYTVFALLLVVRYANAAHARFGYALLDDGLWLQSGVFWRKAVFVPRERVQHTEVNHGPMDRKMGLAKLVLHTAGLRLQHLTIHGLSDAQAHALRDNLLKRAAPSEQFEQAVAQNIPVGHPELKEFISDSETSSRVLDHASTEPSAAISIELEHQGAQPQRDLTQQRDIASGQ